jgi:hypothetical protein
MRVTLFVMTASFARVSLAVYLLLTYCIVERVGVIVKIFAATFSGNFFKI